MGFSTTHLIIFLVIIIVIFGTNDILPIIGIDHYPMTSVPILPYGSLAAVAYGIMVAYSVFQHQLLDVHLALGQSAAYLVRFAFLLLIAVVLELFVGAFAPPGTITTFALVSTILVITLSALIASFLFPKLLGSSAESLERRLLGDEHPNTLASASNLASSLRRQGKHAEAELIDREVLGARRRERIPTIPSTSYQTCEVTLLSSVSSQIKLRIIFPSTQAPNVRTRRASKPKPASNCERSSATSRSLCWWTTSRTDCSSSGKKPMARRSPAMTRNSSSPSLKTSLWWRTKFPSKTKSSSIRNSIFWAACRAAWLTI